MSDNTSREERIRHEAYRFDSWKQAGQARQGAL